MKRVAIILLVLAGWTQASISPPLLDVVRDSDLIVLARVKECAEGWARCEVSKVYQGQLSIPGDTPTLIRVSPVICPGQPPLSTAPHLQIAGIGHDAVLFLKRGETQGEYAPVAFGQWRLAPSSREADLKAIEHLLETWSLPDERRRMEIMIEDFKSGNSRLKWPAHEFIIYTAIRSRDALAYRDILLSLLASENPEWRSLGLTTVQELKIEEAVPYLIRMARDSDPEIVRRASRALRHYATREVVDVLTNLMSHPDPDVRIRAAIDTDRLPDEKVVQGLVRLSTDSDPEVRAIVPRGFYYRPAQVRATILRPILMRMIDDPDARVRASAFRALGRDREQVPVDMLLQRLRGTGLGIEELGVILGTLECGLAAAPRPQAETIIEENETLFIGLVMRGEHNMIGFNALNILNMHPSPGALQAMKDAAGGHPLQYVRDHAKYLLTRHKNDAQSAGDTDQ